MSSISFNNDNDIFSHFKPEVEKINNAITSIKEFGGIIGVVISMPFIAAFFILRLKILKIQLSVFFYKLVKSDLPSMSERERMMIELRFSRMKRMIENQMLTGLKSIKLIAEKNFFARKIVNQLEEILNMCVSNSVKVTAIVYPKCLDLDSPELFEDIKREYANQVNTDWNEKSFDIYDEKY